MPRITQKICKLYFHCGPFKKDDNIMITQAMKIIMIIVVVSSNISHAGLVIKILAILAMLVIAIIRDSNNNINNKNSE